MKTYTITIEVADEATESEKQSVKRSIDRLIDAMPEDNVSIAVRSPGATTVCN